MKSSEAGKYTQAEILSQPETWQANLQELAGKDLAALPQAREYARVIFTGCGSTHYLSMWAACLLTELGHVHALALPASELWQSPHIWLEDKPETLLVAVSRSGETTETLMAAEQFLKRGRGACLAVTTRPGSTLAEMATQALVVPAGQERSVAQTRSFSSMMLAVLTLLTGAVPAGLPEAIYTAGEGLLPACRELSQVIGQDAALDRFFFLGSGRFFGLASEVMLKMKEMSLSYSEAYPFMEFRHGPMSMVNEGSLVVGLTEPCKAHFEAPLLADMRALGARVLALGQGLDAEVQETAQHCLDLPKAVPAPWSDVLYLPLLQLIAFERARLKGLDPDAPRNLSAVIELK